jgi:hypothetical protein
MKMSKGSRFYYSDSFFYSFKKIQLQNNAKKNVCPMDMQLKKNQCPMPICTGTMPAINIAWSLTTKVQSSATTRVKIFFYYCNLMF